MVAGHALERGVAAPSSVLLAVALDAPSHRQGAGRRTEAEEPNQGIAELRSRVAAHHPHPFDRAGASLALEPVAHVRFVRERLEERRVGEGGGAGWGPARAKKDGEGDGRRTVR